MYYLCTNCGRELSESELVQYNGETTEFWGSIETERYYGCPHCTSGELTEIIHRCDYCDNIITEGDTYYQTKDGCIYCEDCITKEQA